MTAGLGAPLELTQTSVKPHACCRYNQGPIDLAIELATANDLTAADVRRVVVGVVTPAVGIVAEPRARKLRPTNDVDAQFSLPFAVGLGVVHRRASLDEYAATTLGDPDVLAIAERTEVEARPHLDAVFPERWPAELTIETVDGRTLTASTDEPKGDPGRPLTPDEARDKFRFLAGAALPARGARRGRGGRPHPRGRAGRRRPRGRGRRRRRALTRPRRPPLDFKFA